MAWPEADWTPVDPFPFVEAGKAFGGATRDPKFVSLRYFRRPDGALVALASLGPTAMGAPGRAHGGATLTILDEALGAACWIAGHRVLTARLTADFRKGVPVPSELLVETKLGAARHRLVPVEGRLIGADGTVYASAEGRFIQLSADAHAAVFGR